MHRPRVPCPPELVSGVRQHPPDLFDVLTGVCAVSVTDSGFASEDAVRVVQRFWPDLWVTLVRRCAPRWMIQTGIVRTVGNPAVTAPPRVGSLGLWAGSDRRRAARLFEMWRHRCEKGLPPSSVEVSSRVEVAHLMCWERHAELLASSRSTVAPRLVAFTLSESEIVAVDRLVFRGTGTKVAVVNMFPFQRSADTYVGVVPAVVADTRDQHAGWSVSEVAGLVWERSPEVAAPTVCDRDRDRLRFVAGALSGTGPSIQELWDLSDDLF